jgi:hypothetical protein
LLGLHDDRPLAQAVGKSDFHLARHEERGLKRGFGRKALRNPPYADAENTEDDNDGCAKYDHLLLTQTHLADRIADRPNPAKLRFNVIKATGCASCPFIA